MNKRLVAGIEAGNAYLNIHSTLFIALGEPSDHLGIAGAVGSHVGAQQGRIGGQAAMLGRFGRWGR